MASRKNKAAEDAQTIAKLIEDIDITMFTTVGSEGDLVLSLIHISEPTRPY